LCWLYDIMAWYGEDYEHGDSRWGMMSTIARTRLIRCPTVWPRDVDVLKTEIARGVLFCYVLQSPITGVFIVYKASQCYGDGNICLSLLPPSPSPQRH
jgi:hypothetical protein